MLTYKIRRGGVVGNDVTLQVPLGPNFDLGTNKSALMQEKYFERIKENLIPSISDMEKIALYPAVWRKTNSGTYEYDLADEIEINFHFRDRFQRDGQKKTWDIISGWSTNDSLGWNMEYFVDEDDTAHDGKYNESSCDNISDLIGFLGFTDDDVKYQKTKIKKSFLRLMYYDSNNIFNQNLLTYSTSFLDANKLYSKYVSMANNDKFINYYNSSKVLFSDDSPKNVVSCFEPSIIGDGEYSSQRISSQITLKSKKYNDASSDGFYIYLFKSDAPTKVSKALFLRAEFNNAGYGKTIPLTLPIDVLESGDITPIKYADNKFPKNYTKDVDLTASDGTVLPAAGKSFDYEQYSRNLYLPLECVYDENIKKYIYYFPWEGDTNDFDNKKITLNFWEPRLNG